MPFFRRFFCACFLFLSFSLSHSIQKTNSRNTSNSNVHSHLKCLEFPNCCLENTILNKLPKKQKPNISDTLKKNQIGTIVYLMWIQNMIASLVALEDWLRNVKFIRMFRKSEPYFCECVHII